MSARDSRSRGELEREVLACLAAAGQAMTAAEVRAALGDRLAYTTVMTTLSRLHDKRALTREARGRAYAYELPGDTTTAAASVTAHRMHRLLDEGPDRAGVLARFIAELSPDDERLLTELLQDDS